MKVAVMQPYIFPYIGYFNLIHSVDNFVFYDDVNFIKKGWINKNKILSGNKEFKFTVPVQDVSQNRLISETKISPDSTWKNKLLKQISYHYRKAPHYEKTISLVNDIVMIKEDSISELAIMSVEKVCEYIGLEVEFFKSSNLNISKDLERAERLIEITKSLNGTIYHNAPGGKELYSKEHFNSFGISLGFVDPVIKEYNQFKKPFISHLSIIDIMMFNDVSEVNNLIESYKVV